MKFPEWTRVAGGIGLQNKRKAVRKTKDWQCTGLLQTVEGIME